jgi:hypothetical protein
MQTLTVRQVVNAFDALRRLADSELTLRVAHKVARAHRLFRQEVEQVNALRQGLFRRLAGDAEQVPPVFVKQFRDEIEAMLDQELTLDYMTVPFAELEELGVVLKPADLDFLEDAGIVGSPSLDADEA